MLVKQIDMILCPDCKEYFAKYLIDKHKLKHEKKELSEENITQQDTQKQDANTGD